MTSADALRAMFDTHGVDVTIAAAPLRWQCDDVATAMPRAPINHAPVVDQTRWVRPVDGGFWTIAKEPCRLGGMVQPPFRVAMPSGREVVVYEIEAGECHG